MRDAEVISRIETSFDVIRNKAHDIQAQTRDFTVRDPRRFMRMTDSGDIWYSPDGGANYRSVGVGDFALSQLGTKIGVPATYIQKCMNAGMSDLAADNVNNWLERYKGSLFIREYSGKIRGVLSDRYSVCDAPEVLDIIGDTVDIGRYKIRGSYINEERLHLRMIDRNPLPGQTEDLFPGIFIDSSDVGRSMLRIQFGIWKQVCTNGLMIAKAGGNIYTQRHIGVDKDEFRMNVVRGMENVEQLAATASEWIDTARSTKMTIEEMQDKLKAMQLGDKHAENVIRLAEYKYGKTRWGFINSITEEAQEFSLERRIDLEQDAGRLLAA